MGILLKFILFGLVFYYILKTVGSFIFRIFGGQVQKRPKPTTQYRREGEINVDSTPKSKKRNSNGKEKDGDYIDFEEVK